LELEKERLYANLEGLPLSERLEVYNQISDSRLSIEKMSKLSQMIDDYLKIAKKLSIGFGIVLARKLFSSIMIKNFDVYLTISFGHQNMKIDCTRKNIVHIFDNRIKHLFSQKMMRFILSIS
jgi:hypothetical protein